MEDAATAAAAAAPAAPTKSTKTTPYAWKLPTTVIVVVNGQQTKDEEQRQQQEGEGSEIYGWEWLSHPSCILFGTITCRYSISIVWIGISERISIRGR
jgi:hypothetical protein